MCLSVVLEKGREMSVVLEESIAMGPNPQEPTLEAPQNSAKNTIVRTLCVKYGSCSRKSMYTLKRTKSIIATVESNSCLELLVCIYTHLYIFCTGNYGNN